MKYLEWVAIALIHIGCFPAVAYPIAWAWRGTWHENRVGRALMWKAASLGALYFISVLGVWFPGDWWLYPYVATLAVVTFALWRQLWVLLSVQREAGKSDNKRGDL